MRTAAVGAIVALPAVGCGSGDEAAFTASTTTSTASSSTASSSPTSTAESSSDAPTASGSTFPAGGELTVDFTFAASGGERLRNPYIAVWVEDADGNLVDTISLWVAQDPKGQKWVRELTRWYNASDGGADQSMSGATRLPGSYSVVWDGTDADGQPVALGDYVLYIEASREHGPYELISQEMTVGSDAFTLEADGDGELSSATVSLRV